MKAIQDRETARIKLTPKPESMDWSKLVEKCCPKCGDELKERDGTVFCYEGHFKISSKRMVELVRSMNEEREFYLSTI